MIELDGILNDFLLECAENLDQLDRDLVELERNPQDRDRLARIFRAVHTIKGGCGFLNFSKLEAVAHVGEGLLSQLRDGKLLLNAAITSGLLALIDSIRALLARIESTGQEGDGDYSTLITRLQSLKEVHKPTEVRKPEEVSSPNPGRSADEDADPSTEAAETSIRVDVGLLDKLMNLVGELVLTRNQILQNTTSRMDPAFQSTTQRLNLITTELQEGVMKTRMQPVGNIWNKFPRVVRDLALMCGKQVRISMEGKETELDKTLIEAIKAPLTHLVRNAVDHGLEKPEPRRQRGKPAEGHLSLRAFHEGGQVNIEIADDGGGIDLERVKHKALERGLIAREQAGRLGDQEALQLIFLPGFSTAETVTKLSGRGVGMDVVKTNIEKIGGVVDLQSRLGQGTVVKIKIPLTLAIIPALLVTVAGDRYAIPQVNLLELVRLEGQQARHSVEWIHGVPVCRLRGNLLPLVHLDRELGVASTPRRDDNPVNIVVLQADERPFGLVVDSVYDTEEIVVKPLGKQLKGIPVFAGATIMGDGRVALILDVVGLAQKAHVLSEVRGRKLVEIPVHAGAEQGRNLIVLFAIGDRRLAIPLALVSRLEEAPAERVEQTVDGEVLQYRGQILPVLRLAQFFPGCDNGKGPPGSLLQVLVCSNQGTSVGLVVDRILDIVEMEGETAARGCKGGLAGSVVVQGRVTGLLDLPALLRGRSVPAAACSVGETTSETLVEVR